MLDQLLGLVLLGLGVQSPIQKPAVLGDNDDVAESIVSATPSIIEIPANLSEEKKAFYRKEIEKRKAALEAKRKEAEEAYKAKRELLKTDLQKNEAYAKLHKASDPGELHAHMLEEKEAFIATMKAKIEQTSQEREEHLAAFKEKMHAFKDQAKKNKSRRYSISYHHICCKTHRDNDRS